MAIKRGAIFDYLLYFAGHVVPRVLSAAALAVYTRRLIPEEYGHYSLALAWVVVILIVFLYWIQSSLQRLLPEHEVRGTNATLIGTARSTGVLIVALLCPVVWLAGRSILPGLALPAVFSWIAQGLFSLVQATTIARRESRLFLTYSSIDSFLKIGIGIAVVTRGLGIGWLLGLPAVSGVLVFVIESIRLHVRGLSRFALDVGVLRSMLRLGAPLAATWIGAIALSSLDRFMFQWLSTPAQLGVYAAAYPLGDAMVQVFATPVLFTFGPRIFAIAAKSGLVDARDHLRQVILYVAVGLGAIIAIAIGSADAVRVVFLGRDYVGAEQVIPYVSAGLALWVLGSLAAKEFELTKQTGRTVAPILAAAVVNGVCNLFMIPRYGGTGAAVATLIGYGTYFALAAVRAGTPSLSIVRTHWSVPIAAVAAGWLVRVSPWPASDQRFARLVFAPTTSLCAYLALVLLARQPQGVALLRLLVRRITTARREPV